MIAERWRFLKFCLVGGSGLAVNLAVVWLGNEVLFVPMAEWWRTSISYALAILVSIFTNFLLNDGWTWRDRRDEGVGAWFVRLGKYYAIAAVAAVLQYATSLAVTALAAWLVTGSATGVLSIWYKWVAVLAGVVVGTLVNFVMNHFWTYREKIEGDPKS